MTQRRAPLTKRLSVRIVHVLYSFGTGGLEKGIATLVSHASSGLEHVIVCLSEAGESTRLLPPGTRVIELHKPPGNSVAFLWRLSRTLKALQPDVVHTRNWGGVDGIIAARLAGIRDLVHGEHGWEMADPDGKNPKRLRVRRFLSRWVREYTCVSKAIERWLLNDVRVRKPVTQIYNGVDTERFCPGDGTRVRTELGIPTESFVVGVVGRLDPIKDHSTLFEAFRLLRLEVPDARLLVVGDGPERQHLEALAGDGVSILGERRDIPDVLRAFDVFVLPSLNEGISNTILEAMATGLPVVATNVGGNPELVISGNTGVLIPPRNPRTLSKTLASYALSSVMCSTHGDAARMLGAKKYSVAAMVAAHEAVWRDIVFRNRKGL